jgi:hypothetical protein
MSSEPQLELIFQKQFVLKKWFLFDKFGVCFKKSGGHKGVKFGRNTYPHWNYSLNNESFHLTVAQQWIPIMTYSHAGYLSP